MKEYEFLTLQRGDIVENKYARGETYVVTGNYGNRVTAARTVDMTNPDEWDLVIKSEAYPKDIDQDAFKKHKCHNCGKPATKLENNPYLEELHPNNENPEEYWCDCCYREALNDI